MKILGALLVQIALGLLTVPHFQVIQGPHVQLENRRVCQYA